MSLRELTAKEIEEITASRPKARRLAVKNFLMTAHHCENAMTALANLERDAKLYNWDFPTVEAMCLGIVRATTKKGGER